MDYEYNIIRTAELVSKASQQLLLATKGTGTILTKFSSLPVMYSIPPPVLVEQEVTNLSSGNINTEAGKRGFSSHSVYENSQD